MSTTKLEIAITKKMIDAAVDCIETDEWDMSSPEQQAELIFRTMLNKSAPIKGQRIRAKKWVYEEEPF